VGLPTLMLELGHESLATTQDYLADVRRKDEAKKAVADADFVPKPRLVTGTDGDCLKTCRRSRVLIPLLPILSTRLNRPLRDEPFPAATTASAHHSLKEQAIIGFMLWRHSGKRAS
jgi:hypothetical protein